MDRIDALKHEIRDAMAAQARLAERLKQALYEQAMGLNGREPDEVEAEPQSPAVKLAKPGPAKRRRTRPPASGPDPESWISGKNATRPPRWLKDLSGVKTIAGLTERYGPGVKFTKGEPLPKEAQAENQEPVAY